MQIIKTNLKFSSLMPRQLTKRAIIHHSASGDVSAETIHGWHKNQSWAGIGYHFVLRNNGTIERGRPEHTIGSHSGPNGNIDSIGIVLTGNFEINRPTNAQLNSLVWLLKEYLFPKYGQLKVIGHKDVMATACPGRNFPWAELNKRLGEEEVIYKTYDDVPDWGKPIVKKLMDRGTILGEGKDIINLHESTLKTLVYLEREGVLK